MDELRGLRRAALRGEPRRIQIVDIRRGAEEPRRVAMAIEAEFHAERLGVDHDRHLVDLPMAFDAVDPAIHVHRVDEVRSGSGYISQSDLRVHFGLGTAQSADLVIHWPSGQTDRLKGLKANQVVLVTEGKA